MSLRNFIQSLKKYRLIKWSLFRLFAVIFCGAIACWVVYFTVIYFFPLRKNVDQKSQLRSHLKPYLSFGGGYTVNRMDDETGDYIIGRLNQTYIKIPKECIFLDVEYEGENPWDASTRIKGPITYDTPIATTNVIINAKTFKTMCTGAERQEWLNYFAKDIPETQWFNISLKSMRNSIIGDNKVILDSIYRTRNGNHKKFEEVLPSFQFETYVNIFRNRMLHSAKFGEKNLEGLIRLYRRKNFHGIEKFEGYPSNPNDPPIAGRPTQVPNEKHLVPTLETASWDRYYTYKGDPQPTTIDCKPFHEIGRFSYNYCKQTFVDKKLQFEVLVQYKLDQIQNWREIEKNLVKELSRFVITTPNLQIN